MMGSLFGVGLFVAMRYGSSGNFCEELCDDATACIDDTTADECIAAREGERDQARELGGSDCVAAHEDYLECTISDRCDDVDEGDSECRLETIEAEIEP
jgi:hypothetical protein